MANEIIPPFPVGAPFTSYTTIDWYQKVRDAINNATTIFWNQLNFTGSNLTDLQTRNHNDLQNIQGGAAAQYYHLTSSQQSDVTNSLGNLKSKSTDPTTTDIPASKYSMYKNTTSGTVKLWVNDGGTLKSVTLT